MPNVTINGREYDLDKLSEEAKSQLGNIAGVDEELRRLQRQVAIYQTARNAYANALQLALPKD